VSSNLIWEARFRTSFELTNPISHGQIGLVILKSSVYSEFLLNPVDTETKINGVCSSSREGWPGLPELLAVDADGETMTRNTSFAHSLHPRSSFPERWPSSGLSRNAEGDMMKRTPQNFTSKSPQHVIGTRQHILFHPQLCRLLCMPSRTSMRVFFRSSCSFLWYVKQL
jgi:hypothetical protein